MTDWSPVVRRAWAVLTSPLDDALASYPFDIAFSGTPVRLAVDRRGHRHVLVPAGQEKVAPDQRHHVLAMSQGTYTFDSVTSTYLDIRCGDPELNSEFDEVVLDILDSVDGSSVPAASASQTINRWRRLFRAGLRRSLSEQERIGLFAELALLGELLAVDGNLSPSVWTGPDRMPHDFELERVCIEAKGRGRTSRNVTIHGLEQLDTHGGKPLHLAIISVATEDAGRTINEMVEELKIAFSDGSGFLGQLGKTGWTADDPLSAILSYSIETVAVVEVDGDTPRLTPSSLVSGLPDGIGDVRYEVSISSLMARSAAITFSELARRALT